MVNGSYDRYVNSANMSNDGILTFSIFGQSIVFYTSGDQIDGLGCSQEAVENPVTSRKTMSEHRPLFGVLDLGLDELWYKWCIL